MSRMAVFVMAGAMMTAPPAAGEALTIVEVNAPAINCVFNPSCTIIVNDSTGVIGLPFIATPGTAWLQSRTFSSVSGTPAFPNTGYIYRISLTQASGAADCLIGLTLNFGPVTKLPYKDNKPADIFVVTTGGLGTVSLKSAEKTGNVIEFSLSKPLCLSGPPDIKNTTFFFGLAANAPPQLIDAQIVAQGDPPIYSVKARVPTH